MRGFKASWFIGVLSLFIAACDAGPSAVLPDGQGTSPSEQIAPPSKPPVWAEPEAAPQAPPPPDTAPRPTPAFDSPALKVKVPKPAGEITKTRYADWPLWSTNRKYSAYENATYHFEKHGPTFGIKTYEDYVVFVHGFVHTPPKGTQTITRNNGDTLFYDPEQNIFAVMTKKGAPRTLFQPYEGAAYWQKQKEIEAGRRTLRED
ncbi:hypothetical protein [Asticcacaulis machinosus]|uniref:Lipoprotein n=1 Tax=Asticcacaulis machinosus TaxID=2984211 RepID=A0ABT5HKM0_9CAUL|nr:hypothetical protein [Asticcacaulis machinosus]